MSILIYRCLQTDNLLFIKIIQQRTPDCKQYINLIIYLSYSHFSINTFNSPLVCCRGGECILERCPSCSHPLCQSCRYFDPFHFFHFHFFTLILNTYPALTHFISLAGIFYPLTLTVKSFKIVETFPNHKLSPSLPALQVFLSSFSFCSHPL